VALPNFLGARNAAAAGAAIGEIIGLAKECSTFKGSGGVGIASTGGGVTCNATAAQTYVATWGGTVSGLRCLAATTTGASKAVITVATNGNLSCALT
jgi:type IV pilus assembly protein PilA